MENFVFGNLTHNKDLVSDSAELLYFLFFINIIFAWMFLILNVSPKLIVTEKTYAHTFHITNNSKIIGY